MASASPDPAAAIVELARIDFARSDLGQVLTTVATLAQQAVAGAEAVSVTLMTQGRGSTAAFTGPLAVALDEQQYDRGYGPCLDACEAGEPLLVGDASTEDRWPAYTRRALELGVRSSMSLPLPVQDEVTGALNFYGLTPRAFDDAALLTGTTFADYAAVAVANAQSYADAAVLTERLRDATRVRAVIEQAKGILVARRSCRPDEALDVLILAARRSDRRLSDVAGALVAAFQDTHPAASDAGLLRIIDEIAPDGPATR